MRTTAASMAPACNLRPIGADCNGISIPRRRSGAGFSASSMVMPPSAGGGGNNSGASRMRGRSRIGSAKSLRDAGCVYIVRGNSISFPAPSRLARWTGTRLSSVAVWGAAVSAGAGSTYSTATAWFTTEGICGTACTAGDVFASRTVDAHLASGASNLRLNEGYLGGRGLRRAW